MFTFLRSKKRSITTIILAGFLGILMMGWGANFYSDSGKRSPTEAAIKINGEPISYEQYQNELQNINELYRQRFGAAYERIRTSINLEQQAVDSSIDQHLGNKFIQSLDIVISKQQVQNHIFSMPFFQKFGLSQETFRQFLQSTNLTEAQLEQMMERDLANQTLVNVLTDLTTPTNSDFNDWLRVQNTKYDFSYAEFDPETFKVKAEAGSLPKDETELTAFYETNKEQFKKPASVKFSYVKFSPADFAPKVVVSEDDIKELYNAKQSSYVEPKSFRIRTITIEKPTPLATAGAPTPASEQEEKHKKDLEAAKARAEEVIKQLKEGADFVKTAEKFSGEKELSKRGELSDWTEAKLTDPGIRAILEKLSIGEFSGVIDSRDQLKIVKLEEFKAERQKSVDEVRSQIETELRLSEAPQYARIEAQTLLEKASDNHAALADLAKEQGFTVQSSNTLLSPMELPNGDKNAEGLVGKIVNLGKNGMDLIELRDADYLVLVEEVKDAHIPELTAVRAGVLESFKAKRAKELAKDAAQKLIDGLKADPKLNFAALSRSLHAEMKSEKGVSKGDDSGADPIFAAPSVKQEIFSLSAASPVAPKVFSLADRFYVIRFDQSTPPTEEELAKARPEFREAEKGERTARLMNGIRKVLREDAEIWIDPNIMEHSAS